MNTRTAPRRYLSFVLAIFVSLCVVSLLGFGYRATKEWQRSSERLVNREIEDSSDLLLTAIIRDMQGMQSRVLANRDWSESSMSLADSYTQVAGAFARYPYPESFFLWRSDEGHMTFFHRADRYPAWRRGGPGAHGHPVVIDVNPPEMRFLRQEIDSHGSSRWRYVALNTTLDGRPYQVVARLTYSDSLQSQLHSVTGFTVNLSWARKTYFPDLFGQITPIATRGMGLTVALIDEQAKHVWGAREGTPRIVREFPFLFLDPTLGRVLLTPDAPLQIWKIEVGPAGTPPLPLANQSAEQTLLVAGTAAFVLCLGLVLSVRAVQERATLAEMRSEFVSSVTHELKMPLANIRAVADTLAVRSVPSEKVPVYGGHLRHEARRLTRLVDNVLAYARITDVANVYTFEPVVPARLVNDALQVFQQPLLQREFNVEVCVPDNLPLVRADRGAMRLVFDNLLDNAIRYSSDVCEIRVCAREKGDRVFIELHDRGIGIADDELSVVTQKFMRGRSAQPGGTGLGLSIVSRIVGDHGGHFALKSVRGKGTTATIALPIYRE